MAQLRDDPVGAPEPGARSGRLGRAPVRPPRLRPPATVQAGRAPASRGAAGPAEAAEAAPGSASAEPGAAAGALPGSAAGAASAGEPAGAGTVFVEDQGGRGGGLAAGRPFAAGETVCEFGRRYLAPEQALEAPKARWAPVAAGFAHAYLAGSGAVYLGDATDRRSGCLVNDFAPPALIRRLAECQHALEAAAWRLQYTKAAGRSAAINVGLRERAGAGLHVVALRRIGAGEPLLAAYGPAFWVERALLDKKTPAASRAALLVFCLAEVAAGGSDFRALPLALRLADVRHVCLPRERDLKRADAALWFDDRPPTVGNRVEALRALGRLWPEAPDLARWLELAGGLGAVECLRVRDFAPAAAVRADWDLPAAAACVACGAGGPKRCGRCRASLYCGRACQAADRAAHDAVCAALRDGVAALRAAAGLGPLGGADASRRRF